MNGYSSIDYATDTDICEGCSGFFSGGEMEGDYCETCAGVTHCWMCEKWGVPRVEAMGTGHVIVCSTDGEYRHVDLCQSCIDDPQRHYRRAKANLQRRASSYSFLNYMPE